MKKALTLTLLFAILSALAQTNFVQQGVFAWKSLNIEKQEAQEVRSILKGATPHLKMLKADAITLLEGKKQNLTTEKDEEVLIIIKEGQLSVQLNGEQSNLGPLSTVMIMPGDAIQYQNLQTEPVTFYLLKYQSDQPVHMNRADSSGGSFIVNYKDLEFKPHDKGGLRNYYRKSTALFKLAEMHVTTLNAGIKSHEPHTHSAAEYVLMISGNTQMQIEDKFCKATAGDLYYLEAGGSHAIQNIGDQPCMYFAFQWEI